MMKNVIDKTKGLPKYVQLMNILKERIKDYQVGDKFYTELELRTEFKLSVSTVARAMRELTIEGYLVRKTGGGSFVKSVSPSNYSANQLPQQEFLVACKFLDNDVSYSPYNWFVWHEIQRGIVNTCQTPLTIISFEDLNNRLGADFSQPVVLLNSDAGILAKLAKLDVPYVLINSMQTEQVDENAVNLDRMNGAYEAMSYLFDDLKHKKIALIAGDYPSHSHRIAAYHIAHVSRGLSVDDNLVVKIKEGDENAGYSAMKKLLDSRVELSAVFVDTDVKARGVYMAVLEAGLQIPQDISIVGFDDIPDAAHLAPPLTTVSGCYYELGCSAMNLLYRRLNTGTDLPAQTVKTKLKVRESTQIYSL